MKRIIKMIFALWPFYVGVLFIIGLVWALNQGPSTPGNTPTPTSQQQTPPPVPKKLSPEETLNKIRIEKEAAKLAKQLIINQRKQFAKNYERQLLDKGMDVYATTHGRENTTLKIKWILVSRPVVHKLINDGDMVENLRNRGFTKLVMTDGYNGDWNIDLRPGK
jgi:hypothetical protein